FRLLYEVVDDETVLGLILLRQRQDISLALVDYCILHK
ncbi:type II toxin-antitoxin system RelE/ParE family toxin, partial [Vibrio pectenicida]|nr:type II toxin-antitoxin system RelE/ParE family toxin [Vibrio pectenicida]